MKKLNWALISSDITAAFTVVAAIPYDKDTMELVNHLFPQKWIPYVVLTSIGATLTLRLVGRWQQAKTHPSS